MTRITTSALVVRIVEFGDSDLIVTLVTEVLGKVSASVRGGRKSSRRVGGTLEPLHTLEVELDDRGGEFIPLRESRVVRVRAKLAQSLVGIESAGLALRWARHIFPLRVPEPIGWRALVELLDALDDDDSRSRQQLARAGLRLLATVGYALDFERCVACGRLCPDGKAAAVDPARGGLVCHACGGARIVLTASMRRSARVLIDGGTEEVSVSDAALMLRIVDGAMVSHTGFEGS